MMLYLASGTVLTKVSAEPGERTAAVPDGITEIGAYCFSGQNWQKIILPDSVEVIERSAFERCKALRSVRLSENLYYLGYRAFADCTALETLRIPASIEDVALEVLAGCTGLTALSLPDTLFRANLLQDSPLPALKTVSFRHRGRDIYINDKISDWEMLLDYLSRPAVRHPYANCKLLTAQLFDLYPEMMHTGNRMWYIRYLADQKMAEPLAEFYKKEHFLTAAEKDELVNYLIQKSEADGDADLYLMFMRLAGLTEDGISRGKFRL
jgi:hypothetical protein